jgi:hypothetical protein
LPKGSSLCGLNRNVVCAPNQRCINNRCIARAQIACGNAVCTVDQECLRNRCYPRGSYLCGSWFNVSVCTPSQRCVGNRCVQ